jgi:hypothetical protein
MTASGVCPSRGQDRTSTREDRKMTPRLVTAVPFAIIAVLLLIADTAVSAG